MKNNTKSTKPKNDELELDGTEVFAVDAEIEGAMTDSEAFALDARFASPPSNADDFNYPEIVAKLETGAPLHEIERLMAATAIHDWLRLKEARKIGGKKGAKGSPRPNAGRPRKPDSELSASALSKRRSRDASKL